MGWLMSVLGAALALAGAVSLANGISYIRLDWGATEVMAGTVALAGGLVTLALGAVLFALRDLSRRIEAPAPFASDPDDAATRSARGRTRSRVATVGLPGAEPPSPVTAEAPGLPAAVEVHDPEPVPEPPPAPPTMVDAPTVVGRYEANGASYVLFSDGTIEVETETGTHRFASMADLKDHIDRQEVG